MTPGRKLSAEEGGGRLLPVTEVWEMADAQLERNPEAQQPQVR